MRISASLRLTLFMVVAFVVGCSGGASEPEAYTKDSGPPEPGMVWNDTGEYWEWPAGGGGGNDDGYGGGYGQASTDGYGDNGDSDESGDPYATGGDSSGDYDPYATGGDNSGDYDPYATSGDSSGNSDPYATDANSNNDGYADADPYANSDQIDPQDRDSADDSSSDDAYASASNGYGQPAAGGGTGVFAEEIEPILRRHCYNCHGGGPRGSKGDLQLHTTDAIAGAGIITAREPEDSEIFIRISMDVGDKGRMPPKGAGLSAEEVAKVESWIKSGADFGAGGGGGANGGYAAGGYGDAYATADTGARGGSDPYGDDAYADEGTGQRPASRPSNLAEAASVSFQRGHDAEAMNQLFAQSLVKSSVGDSVLDKYKWVPALKRSKLAVRWGVGIKYAPKDGYDGSPRPAGVTQDLPGGDNDRSGSDREEIAETSFRNRTLDYYTGDIGDELIFRLQSRIERGYYGDILKEEISKALAGSDDEFDDDEYGDSYGGSSRGGGGYGGGYGSGGSRGSSPEKPDSDLIEQIMPGVVMVGEASQSVLLERAKEHGVDLLVVFDISVDANRRIRIVNNSTRVRLYDVAANKQVALTGSIKNVDLQRARAEDPDDETIIKEMNKIFSVVDDSKPYKVREFPTVTSEKAKASVIGLVRDLINQESENPLWKLSEVRFYHSRGLLKDAHLASAYNKISPQYAAKLTNIKDDHEIGELLSHWLVSEESDYDDADESEDGGPRRRKPEFR